MGVITMNDNALDIVTKMSQGNPGAATTAIQILQKTDWVAQTSGILLVLELDKIGLYGSELYKLYADCCRSDLDKVGLVVRNWQKGILSTQDILDNVRQPYGTAFELKSLEDLYGGDAND